MAKFRIEDQTTHSTIIQYDDTLTTALSFWALPKDIKIRVRQGVLSVFFDDNSIPPRFPRVSIVEPVSSDDSDLFNKLQFMVEGNSGGGGAVTSLVNGLNLNTGIGKLGGVLIEDTGINLATFFLNLFAQVTGNDVVQFLINASTQKIGLRANNGIDVLNDIYNYALPSPASAPDIGALVGLTSANQLGFFPAALIQNILFVSPNGNDANAQAGSLTNMWANPTVAVAAANAGQLVVIFTGDYTIGTGGLADDGAQRLVKNGVKVIAYSANINFSDTAAGSSFPFRDDNVAGIYSFEGYGQTNVTSNQQGVDVNLCVENINSELFIRLHTFSFKSRMRNINYKTIDIRVDGFKDMNRGIFSNRPTVNLDDSKFIVHFNKLDNTNNTNTYEEFEIRNVGQRGYVEIIGSNYQQGLPTNGKGLFNFYNCDGATIKTHCTNITRDTFPTYTEQIMFNMQGNDNVAFDIDLNTDNTMKPFSMLNNRNCRGRIIIYGRILQSTSTVNPIFIVDTQFNRYNIVLDLEVTTPLTIVRPYIIANASPSIWISGRIKHDGTTSPFGNRGNTNDGRYPTFDNLTIETTYSESFGNPSPSVPVPTAAIVAVKNCWANKPVDPLMIDQKLEVINVPLGTDTQFVKA